MNADLLGRLALLAAIERHADAIDHGVFRESRQADAAQRPWGQIEWPRHR